jgi:hypothetical protein
VEEQVKKKRIIVVSILIALFLSITCCSSGFFTDFVGQARLFCFVLPGMSADGEASAKIYTWVDGNENGKIDSDEIALPNVEISYPISIPEVRTDASGNAEAGVFKPGCACNCWKDEYVEVVSPPGYHPTTPLKQDLKGDDLLYAFGFNKTNP